MIDREGSSGAPGRVPGAPRLPGTRQLLAVPTAAWFSLFFLAPLVILVVYSFGQIDIITYRISFGWTVQNYENIVDSLYLRTIGRSLLRAPPSASKHSRLNGPGVAR